jgi:hypothetical protein
MTDLVTLAQAQAFVQDSTTASQAWVQACLDAASAAVIDYIGVDPSTQTRTELYSGNNTGFLYPKASGKSAPLSGVTSITINPAMTSPTGGWWAGTNNTPFVVDMSNVAFDDTSIYFTNTYIFPRGKKNITVVYTAGYALTATAGLLTLPSSISQAVLYTTKAFFTAMGKEMNASSESYSGVMAQSFSGGGPGGLPPAAAMLLKPYQKKMFAP